MEKGYSTLPTNDYIVPETRASIRTAAIETQMMSLVAGMERTQSQWSNLLSLSGLSHTKVWHSGNRWESVIEASVKPWRAALKLDCSVER